MSMNIKSERVHALAKEAAARTGQSQTRVVQIALARLLHELDRQSAPADPKRTASEIAADFQRRLKAKPDVELSADWLYDSRGLPS